MDSREPIEDHELAACPFCRKPLTQRESVNPSARCDTEGCWMRDRMIAIPLDDPRQVEQWNRCRPSPVAESGVVAEQRDVLAMVLESRMRAYAASDKGSETERLQAIALADVVGCNEKIILSALRRRVAESTPADATAETYRCLACGSNNHEHRCTERKAPVEVEGLVERDNHHNAAKCPHCTDNGRFVMVEATELATLKQQLAEMEEALEADKARLDYLQYGSEDLRCFDIPTGGGDADIGWRVIGHYQAEPRERVIAEVWHDSVRDVIDRARALTRTELSAVIRLSPAPRSPDMADAQKAESTPSPDTEGVRLAVRHEVAAFALLMERKLRANDHKPGWKNGTPTALADRAQGEVAELREVVRQLDRQIIWAPYPDARANGWHRKNPDTGLREVGVGYVPAEGSLRAELEQRAASEAADVANMAMMVADVCGALKSSPPVSTVDEEGGGA